MDRDSISNQYREHAITWFESNTAPLYTYLNAELLQSDTTKTAKIEFDTKMVDFGEICITYNGSEENLGAFNRSIILITNATKRNEILTAKGQATL